MMKSIKIFLVILLMSAFSVFAQEEAPDNRPVSNPFESGVLIDNQTIVTQTAKTLEATIEHRFGKWNNGITDVYGVYAPSNIRLGINYTPMTNLMVGYGYTKDRKLMDFRVKYNIINQTRSESYPVAVTFYGNMGITCVDSADFGVNYQFTNRFSYFAQLIIARKFNNNFSMQISPSFSHLNSVDSLNEHDKIGISISARYKISAQSAVIFNYDIPLDIKSIYENSEPINKPKPNLGFGWEISSGTHVFQIFAGTANTLSPQYNMMENQNDWAKKGHLFEEMMIGFNITRLWNF